MNIGVLIPAYDPDEKLTDLIRKLALLPFRQILVVDDGSSAKSAAIFHMIEKTPRCRVVHHPYNQGKGAALKTGINALLELEEPLSGCVTADADGQHLPEDILHVAKTMAYHPGALILGSRDFGQNYIPSKSKTGNIITRNVFRLMTGKRVTDTQTGLRAIPVGLMEQFANLPGNRYEYEMNMLMQAAKTDVPIVETPINTVYFAGNQSTHFAPLKDSLRIYAQIFKFALSSLTCSVVDIGVFALITYSLLPSSYVLLEATVIARLCSSGLNFFLNKNLVFKSPGKTSWQAAKYYVLCISQMLLSWLLLQGMAALGLGNLVLLKMLVDTSLFFLSYAVQHLIVFGREHHHVPSV